MRLKDVATLQTGLEKGQALFWLKRRGTPEACGQPVKAWAHTKYHFGLNLTPAGAKILDPMYLFYMLEAVWSQGHWRRYCLGSLQLQHVRKQDFLSANLPVGQRMKVQLPPFTFHYPGQRYTLTETGEAIDREGIKLRWEGKEN